LTHIRCHTHSASLTMPHSQSLSHSLTRSHSVIHSLLFSLPLSLPLYCVSRSLRIRHHVLFVHRNTPLELVPELLFTGHVAARDSKRASARVDTRARSLTRIGARERSSHGIANALPRRAHHLERELAERRVAPIAALELQHCHLRVLQRFVVSAAAEAAVTA